MPRRCRCGQSHNTFNGVVEKIPKQHTKLLFWYGQRFKWIFHKVKGDFHIVHDSVFRFENGIYCHIDIAMPRHNNDWHLCLLSEDLIHHANATLIREVHVCDDYIRKLTRFQIQKRGSVLICPDIKVLQRQGLLTAFKDRIVIFRGP